MESTLAHTGQRVMISGGWFSGSSERSVKSMFYLSGFSFAADLATTGPAEVTVSPDVERHDKFSELVATAQAWALRQRLNHFRAGGSETSAPGGESFA